VAERLNRTQGEFLERTGRPFWQDESYDHWVRNSKEHGRIISYIEAASAGLVDWPG
jgi:hypothetical protein